MGSIGGRRGVQRKESSHKGGQQRPEMRLPLTRPEKLTRPEGEKTAQDQIT